MVYDMGLNMPGILQGFMTFLKEEKVKRPESLGILLIFDPHNYLREHSYLKFADNRKLNQKS